MYFLCWILLCRQSYLYTKINICAGFVILNLGYSIIVNQYLFYGLNKRYSSGNGNSWV
jgi:hypothetical protein